MDRVDPEMTRRARALRTNATKAERALWHLLSRYRPKFTRQLVVGPFILDLACRAAKLAVEVDGGQHAESGADVRRTRWLEAEGWVVVRYWNSDVADNAEGVAEAILLKGRRAVTGGRDVSRVRLAPTRWPAVAAAVPPCPRHGGHAAASST